MLYRFRVHLPNIKGFSRVYLLRPTTTLYTFSKKMTGDMEFPYDQIVLYKSVDDLGTALHRYSTVDLGFGTTDNITAGKLVKAGETEFVYFYDTTNKLSVLISYEGEVQDNEVQGISSFPALVEQKGPNPIDFINGYVAFEDLPQKERIPVEDDDIQDDDEDNEEDEIFAEEEDVVDEDEVDYI
ncbi:MAG: hypothetical protein HUJ95_04590 [Bacteroidales bacterium]|nr:hypothetical protein [Bacteroidales bacterium]